MFKLLKLKLKSNAGISIIFAIIVIVLLGLAGSIFAYLMASGSITSRNTLLSAEAKYAAKSGVEITMYEIEQAGAGRFSNTQLQGCPVSPVLPPDVSGSASPVRYLSGNLTGSLPNSVNYTPTFCSVYGKLTGGCYIITSNGFAGGTLREITAEVGIKNKKGGCTAGTKTEIYAETELPNG